MQQSTPQLSILGILSVFSLLLMGVDARLGSFKSIRSELDFLAYPLQMAIGTSVDFVQDKVKATEFFIKDRRWLRSELDRLEKKNRYLLAENQRKKILEIENRELKALWKITQNVEARLIPARLLQISTDPYAHYVIVDKGKQDGVVMNQAILDAHGIIGQVENVHTTSAKVKLITDRSHAIPIQNSRNGLRGIVSGLGNVNALVVLHTPIAADYKVGDLLLSSGLGGRFPAGYPVGVVSAIRFKKGQAFSTINVIPKANFLRMNQVLIVTAQTVRKKAPSALNQPPSAVIPSSILPQFLKEN